MWRRTRPRVTLRDLGSGRPIPCPPVATLVGAFVPDAPNPDVLLFGDSVVHRVARGDRQRKGLATLVTEGLQPAQVCSVVGDGYHPGLYRPLVKIVAAAGRPPRLVILPVNLRSFSPQWSEHPLWRHDDLIAAAESYLAQPSRGIPRITTRQREYAIRNDRYLGITCRYIGDSRTQVSEFVSAIRHRHRDPALELLRQRAIFTFHYMFELSQDNKMLKSLVSLIREVKALGALLLVYVTPVNVEAGEHLLGPLFLKTVTRSVGLIEGAVKEAMEGEAGAYHDWATLLPARAFFHMLDPAEHLNESGRSELSERIVQVGRCLVT